MPHLTAEVISIGDEMTSGARLDTNSQWLSRRIGELGIEVIFHTTVGDALADNVEALRIASHRADMVVVTGGLGPTRDDLTREALGRLIDHPLEFREESFRHIESMFASRGREMPQRNRVQAMFPHGSTEILNPQGTAPGIDLIVQRAQQPASRIFCLPGVPAEMKRMFDESVAPRILQQTGREKSIRHVVMKFFGTGESEMEQRLGDMIARDRQPRVGITASAATISLRITAMADSDRAGETLITTTRDEILQRVGEYYFGDGESFEQQHAVDAMLRQRGQTLVVVELGYAAPLGDWFAALGDTPSFRGGLSLANSDDLKRITSARTLDAAQERLRQLFDADWALIIDQYPSLVPSFVRPADASASNTSPAASASPAMAEDRPLSATEAQLIVLGPDGHRYATSKTIGGHPSILHARFAKSGLQWLRQVLAQNSTP